jgi:CBS domain-containing protein
MGTMSDVMTKGVVSCPGTATIGEAAERMRAEAIETMREQALRRIPVVDDGRAIGIVSLGDLALHRDPDSALGEISASAPNS